ncbi:MAG: hypothetical protein H0W99_11730 [Acidobacteria bacterium]|nr:hypothetical protein [Acidobacteriota bacterium]
MRAHINGEKQFGGAFQAYDVDLVGVGFNKRPPLAPGPFFHRSGPIKYGPGAKPQGPTYLSYNGCRITHRETGITVDVHWWMTHGLIATLKNLPSGQVKNGIAIAQKALGFFAMERRGNPKIGEETISTALQKLGPEATQREIAQELKVTERGLEKWRERHGFSTWDEVKARYV